MRLSYSYPKMQTSPWSDTSKSRYWFASDYANVQDGRQTGSNIKILSSVSHIYFVHAITNMLTPSWSDTTRSRYWVHKWLCKFSRWPPNRKVYRKSVFINFTFILEKICYVHLHTSINNCVKFLHIPTSTFRGVAITTLCTQTDGRTNRRTDNLIPVYPSTSVTGGIIIINVCYTKLLMEVHIQSQPS